MDSPVKRVAAIHDLSGYGRAALSSIIPIISNMGHQVCPFPTAILSSNTAFFEDFTLVDLTDSMVDYMNHWKKIDMDFHAIYSGFIASAQQVDIILDFINYFDREDNIIVVDPVMGDDGRLYPTITDDIVVKMKELVSRADLVTPNFTEALYILNREDWEEELTLDYVKNMLMEISNMGPEIVVITSVPDLDNENYVNVYAYDRGDSRFWNVRSEYIDVEYPGTGDSFTSVLIASLLRGESLAMALDRSVQFISLGIKETYAHSQVNREGILLEKILTSLNMPIMNSRYKEV